VSPARPEFAEVRRIAVRADPELRERVERLLAADARRGP
jgi:hypothetical protein